MLNGVTCLELNNSPENGRPEFDVIFVHGLSSDALSAWKTAGGDIWPTWLRQTVQNCRVALLNYPAPALFDKRESAVSIKERGRNLADFLPTIGVGRRPTIYVCHSLGGLIIKEILKNCIEDGCSIELAANTIGLIYLATPHSGANLANLSKFMGSQITADLCANSPYILELRDWFSAYAHDRKLFVSAYAETQSLYGTLVVSRDSSDPNVEGCVCIPIDGDHSTICKPGSPSSDIYLRIQRDVEKAIGRYEKMTATHLVALKDILALPSLTNNMYFDVLNVLNRELSNGHERGIIISNPCGGPKPSCIIVSEHESVISKIRPLQDRWPDRFKIEVGLLGEFTDKGDHDNANAQEIVDSKARSAEFYSELAVAIADYLADQVVFDVKVSTFWSEKSEVYFVAALHTMESAIRRSIEKVLSSARPEGDERRRTSKRLSIALSKIERIQAIDKSETVAESIKCLYQRNSFTFRVSPGRDTREHKSSSLFSVIVKSAKLHSVLYERDAFVFCANTADSDADSLFKWTSANTRRMWPSSGTPSDPIDVGAKLILDETEETGLIVESVDQTVFFPMVDKVTSLHSVIVLSGANVERGSSGTTVFRENGLPFAMLIGRSFKDGECKALAVTIEEIAANAQSIRRLNIPRFGSEVAEQAHKVGEESS